MSLVLSCVPNTRFKPDFLPQIIAHILENRVGLRSRVKQALGGFPIACLNAHYG
jgi:hypothetical protein